MVRFVYYVFEDVVHKAYFLDLFLRKLDIYITDFNN